MTNTASMRTRPTPELWTLVRPNCGRTSVEARLAEQEGWDGIFVPDSQNLAPDVLVQLSLCVGATDRLRLATGVANPVTRHPAALACAMATLQAESQGRVVLGIGRGDSSLAHIGAAPAPVRRFERYLAALQTYLRGDDLAFDRMWLPDDVPGVEQLTLGTAPSGSALHWLDRNVAKVPLDVAASGPKVIRAAVAHSDRITFSIGADPSRLSWACNEARTALAASHRPLDSVQLGAYVVVAVSDHVDEARSLAVTGGLASFSRHSVIEGRHLPSVAPGDVKVEESLANRYDMNVHGRPVADHLAAFTPDFVDRNAIAGTTTHCLQRISELWALGLDHLVIVERSEKVGAAEQSHHRVVTEIMPELRRLGVSS